MKKQVLLRGTRSPFPATMGLPLGLIFGPEPTTNMAWSMLAAAAAIFAVLMLMTAPYGRHSRAGWGPTIDASTMWTVRREGHPFA